MLLDVIFLVLGLFLVIKGGDWFVDSSVTIARAFHIPPIVIGGTLVSIATTTPELVVSTTASVMGDSGIALGNAVGSAIANIGLIVGVVAVMGVVKVDVKDFRRRSLWMLGASVLVILFAWSLHMGRFFGAILLGLASVYLILDYRQIREQKKKHGPTPSQETFESIPLRNAALLFGTGAVMVILGSRLLVTSGSSIATALGIPSVVIGLSVIAIGTSLPELVTAVTAMKKKVPDLSIGNIVGANVLNLAAITGAAALIRPLTLSVFTRNYSFIWLSLFVLSMIGFFWKKGEIGKKQGLIFLGLYSLYIVGLVISSL